MQGRAPATIEIDPRELETGDTHTTRAAGRETHVHHHNAPSPPRKRVNVSRNTKGLYTWEFTYESVGETDAEVVEALRRLDVEIRKAFLPDEGPATKPHWESEEF